MPSSALSPASRLIPAHMDRLPWSRFYTMVIVGLGTAWILDGIEVQIVAANGFAQDLGMSTTEITASATFYLLGQVLGALLFGRLTDRIGRKKLFVLTLAVYLIGSGLAGAAFSLWFFYLCRFIAGAGIGGEYSAINSAIDELIPAKYRGRVGLAVNGTYWAGVALGAVATIFLLNPALIDAHWSWRIGFFLGPVLGLVLIVIRRHIPESPRWMLTHGHAKEAEEIAASIEHDVASRGIELEDVDESQALTAKAEEKLPLRTVARVFLKDYPQRTILGATLMITQFFLFNAIFFTYAIVLGDVYDVPKDSVGLYMIPFAIGNLLGPLLLGRFFDTIGRRKMIFGTYGIAALVLTASAFCFQADLLTPTARPEGFVVVGVSGSSGSPMALRWALETARRLELRLVAVRAYKVPATSAGTVRPTPSRVAGSGDVLEASTLADLEAHVRAALGDDADEVELRAVRGGRRRVLTAASDGAAMLVVDAPRRRELEGEPSFVRSLVYRAQCPVVIMPPRVSSTPAEPWVQGRRTARG